MIETSRLLIRPWTTNDVPHYQAMSFDVGYTCFSPPGIFLVKDESEALQKVNGRIKNFEEHRIGKFLVFEKSSGSFVGTCGGDFFDLRGEKQVELGYRMMLSHWGKGFATEAASALVHYLLSDVKLQSVYGFALHQNQQSLKILEKIGMKYQYDFSWAGLSHKLFRIEKP
ncbi:MAG TPA: GNAT family N-acetyltransferase [Bdellovibrio sp.]|nr:GNAT family N-acetyltransferase [Bdellovibrio sp.]